MSRLTPDFLCRNCQGSYETSGPCCRCQSSCLSLEGLCLPSLQLLRKYFEVLKWYYVMLICGLVGLSCWYVDWSVDWLMIDWLIDLEQGLTTWTRQAWNSYRFTHLWLTSVRIKGMHHHASTMGIYFFICHLWYFLNHRATFSSFMGKNIFGFSSNTDSYTFCLLSSSSTEKPWVLQRLSMSLSCSFILLYWPSWLL